jgi:hypothetical protein
MPSITIWDRIEPRCRANDPTPGLQARVHDPLWLLARQWQVGEFEGRDAGSPVVASVQSSVARIDRFSVGGQVVQAYDGVTPFETLAEREVVRPPTSASDLRQAAEAGQYFLRLLGAAGLPATVASAYLAQYSLTVAATTASDVAALAPVIAGRVIDGIKLHADLIAAGNVLPASPAIPAAEQSAVLATTRAWLRWYSSLFSETTLKTGWSPDRMEYRFSIASAGDAGSCVAQEYDGGTMDWHTFDSTTVKLTAGTQTPTVTQQQVVATPVTFRGMPSRRFWELEDGGTNIGLISAAAEDLGRLLLREFALIYGNDWFQFPLNAPIGSRFTVTSLSVSDTFGVNIPIPNYAAADGPFGKWRIFSLSTDPQAPPVLQSAQGSPPSLLLVPGAVAPFNGSAIEQVLMLRDEMANVAWGIEQTVVGASGQPLDRTLEWRIAAPPSAPPSGADGVLEYRLGSTVPDYWIPFLPVQLDAAGHLQLKRGRLPGIATGPQGRMLTEAVSVFLEEVPREGVALQRRYRWARATDGSGYLWIGRLRGTGRGEGRSGLRFDYVE